jgi:hypothetical protein
VIQEVVIDRTVKDYDPDLLVSLESADEFLKLCDHLRTHHVDRRIVDCDSPISGRGPGNSDLCGLRWCACVCHGILQSIFVPETG